MNPDFESAEGKQIKIAAGNVEVYVTLNDSGAAADLAAMLPLELTLQGHIRWVTTSVNIDYYKSKGAKQ